MSFKTFSTLKDFEAANDLLIQAELLDYEESSDIIGEPLLSEFEKIENFELLTNTQVYQKPDIKQNKLEDSFEKLDIQFQALRKGEIKSVKAVNSELKTLEEKVEVKPKLQNFEEIKPEIKSNLQQALTATNSKGATLSDLASIKDNPINEDRNAVSKGLNDTAKILRDAANYVDVTSQITNLWGAADVASTLMKGAGSVTQTFADLTNAKSKEDLEKLLDDPSKGNRYKKQTLDALAKPVVNPKKYRYEGTRANELCEIVDSLDAFTGYYTAWFSNSEGNPIKLNITENLKYYYYFYLDEFKFKPVKKTQTSIQYGAYKTSANLWKPDGKNTFDITIVPDVTVAFWKYVMNENLGADTINGILANSIQGPKNKKVDLNIIFPRMQNEEKLKRNIFLFNHFILKDIRYTNISAINFNYKLEQLKLQTSGICSHIIWEPNYELTID